MLRLISCRLGIEYPLEAENVRFFSSKTAPQFLKKALEFSFSLGHTTDTGITWGEEVDSVILEFLYVIYLLSIRKLSGVMTCTGRG